MAITVSHPAPPRRRPADGTVVTSVADAPGAGYAHGRSRRLELVLYHANPHVKTRLEPGLSQA